MEMIQVKNNPLYNKITWSNELVISIRFLAFIISIIFTPLTILFWLFNKENFKDMWVGMGFGVLLFLCFPFIYIMAGELK